MSKLYLRIPRQSNIATMLKLDASGALLETNLPLPIRRGKVRDCYDLGDRLAIVSTDRISAFDYVLPVGIPDKGRILTSLSQFWFEFLETPNHLISTVLPAELKFSDLVTDTLNGRTMIVRKADVVPFECVVRGYLEGSGWREYQVHQAICDHPLPPDLTQCAKLPNALFTPATKAETGHDENVSFAVMAQRIGSELASTLRERSIEIYNKASLHAQSVNLILADTKFEFGFCDGELILVDEVLTPDSSRYWPADEYQPGRAQPSFDKQFVREWLMQSDWDRNSPPPPLPPEIVEKTREKYWQAARLLTNSPA